MCGRFSQTKDLKQLELFFDAQAAKGAAIKPRYNIAPTQQVPVVVAGDAGRELRLMRWGLVPHWAKDDFAKKAWAGMLINARGETVADKASFREAFKYRRCIVPADGFYEWKKEAGGKQPVRIVIRGTELFGMAGLWTPWTNEESEVLDTFTIITCPANALLAKIHDRMPVILREDVFANWLDPGESYREALQPLLTPFPEEAMEYYAVSKAVNSPRNDTPEILRSPDISPT
ncbi:SOS response-associated peptidase [bacterium]|nr:SOS response-associated peptidase [bacterium]